MSSNQASRVSLVRTTNRTTGVERSIEALDASAVAVLKHLGSNARIMETKIFAQEQIARAAELGLGAASASEIELVPADRDSREYGRHIMNILSEG